MKCDDVSGTGMMKEGFVEPGDFFGFNQIDAEFVAGSRKGMGEEMMGDLAEQFEVDLSGVLAVAQKKFGHEGLGPRCSS